MLAAPRVVSRVNKDVEYGRVPNKVQKIHCKKKGRPKKAYPDNAKTFVAGAKWLKRVMDDEKFNDFLARMSITWQFNLSRVPWWGGQHERWIEVVKQALYKTIGNGFLF